MKMRKKRLLLALIFSVSIVQAQVGINTTDPQAALHVDGDLIVTGISLAHDTTYIESLYTNPEGLVVRKGKKEKIVSFDYFAIDTRREIMDINSADQELVYFNNSIFISFKLENIDIEANTLGMKLKDGFVEVSQTGAYQISSSVNFQFVARNDEAKLYLNMVLEKSSDGGNTWVVEQAIRPVHTIYKAAGQLVSVVFPITITNFTEGDLLRIAFKRTKYAGTLQGDYVDRIRIASYFSIPSFQFFMTKLTD